MLNNHVEPGVIPQVETPRKAGDVEPFPGGKVTYLAPLPLPAPIPPYGPHIGELNDVHMDFGLGSPQVFMWQMTLGGPLSLSVLVIFLFPLITGLMGISFGYGQEAIWESMVGMFETGYENSLMVDPLILLIGLAVWHHVHKKTRLNHPNPLQPPTP